MGSEEERLNPALVNAAFHNDATHVHILLDQGADPNAESGACFRLMCKHGNLDLVDRVLRERYISAPETWDTPITLAIDHGHAHIVRRLLQDSRFDPSLHNQRALKLAATLGYADIIDLLLRDARVNCTNFMLEALKRACRAGHVSAVQRLLQDDRIDPREDGQAALWFAAKHGRAAVIHLLLQDDRVDPSARYQAPILLASQYGHVAALRRLLEDDRVDPNFGNGEAVREAYRGRHIEVLQLLLPDRRIGTWPHVFDKLENSIETRSPGMMQVLSEHACKEGTEEHAEKYLRIFEDAGKLPVVRRPPHRRSLIQYQKRQKSYFQDSTERLFSGEQHLLARIAQGLGPLAVERVRTFFDFA